MVIDHAHVQGRSVEWRGGALAAAEAAALPTALAAALADALAVALGEGVLEKEKQPKTAK